jgi:hypothetical protein
MLAAVGRLGGSALRAHVVESPAAEARVSEFATRFADAGECALHLKERFDANGQQDRAVA